MSMSLFLYAVPKINSQQTLDNLLKLIKSSLDDTSFEYDVFEHLEFLATNNIYLTGSSPEGVDAFDTQQVVTLLEQLSVLVADDALYDQLVAFLQKEAIDEAEESTELLISILRERVIPILTYIKDNDLTLITMMQ